LPFVHRLRVRYHECDRQDIVFNAQWFTYFDVTLTELWRVAFGSYDALVESGTDVVVVDAQASFRAPAHFDEEIDMSYAIERLGTTSMTVTARAHRGGELLVDGRLVYVFVDPATMAKREIPDDVRERLQPWLTGSAAR
jgi:acyl-CoA thioester hydrolase